MQMSLDVGLGESYTSIEFKWVDENGNKHQNVLEVEVPNVDKPRTVRFTLDGVPLAIVPPFREHWCEHITISSMQEYCYNGLDIRNWHFCPKCGKMKPN